MFRLQGLRHKKKTQHQCRCKLRKGWSSQGHVPGAAFTVICSRETGSCYIAQSEVRVIKINTLAVLEESMPHGFMMLITLPKQTKKTPNSHKEICRGHKPASSRDKKNRQHPSIILQPGVSRNPKAHLAAAGSQPWHPGQPGSSGGSTHPSEVKQRG